MIGRGTIHNATQMVDLIQEVGFLPLLYSGISGFSADEVADSDCGYSVYEDGWDWPMWKWKGPIVTEGGCVYGKFFDKKAGYISMDWWPDFMNWRRHAYPAPSPGSIEETIVMTLREHGSLITRELRAACGFTGTKMRSRFDSYVTRLQMSCRIITQDFVYPRDKHGKEYGWGWSLLTTPEQLLGKEACQCDSTPEESLERMLTHLRRLLPRASEQQILKLIK